MSQQLLKDLKDLINANIISEETAKQIGAYYDNKKSPSSNRLATIIGILGALLIGFGFELVIAHNWDEFSRTIQTLFAFVPLLITQGLCLYAILRKNDNRGWKESSAVLLFFTVASSITLVSQIYQVEGNLEDFLLVWIALSIPLVYIMSSAMVSLLIIALATWYACLYGYTGSYFHNFNPPWLYLAILILLAPGYYYQYLRRPEPGNGFTWHNWFIVTSSMITLGTFLGRTDSHFHWVFIGYMSLAGLFHLVGKMPVFARSRLFANPYRFAGSLVIISIFLCWSFKWLWQDYARTPLSDESLRAHNSPVVPIFLILFYCLLYALQQWKQKRFDFDLMSLSPIIFAAGLLLFQSNFITGMLLFNLWVLVLAVFYIRTGAARDHLGLFNLGLLIIASLAIMRFFDTEIPFIWKGLIFLITGAGFFIANYVILKKRKSLSKNSGI